MKRLQITSNSITLEEGCNKYLDYCRQRSLREDTIRHYHQSYLKLFTCFSPSTPITDITQASYNEYVSFLKEQLTNSVTINAYLRDFVTTLHYLMEEGYIPYFKMRTIRVDKHIVETYTDAELSVLLKKPDIKRCSFIQYQCWVITNFLFATGVRQRSLIHIKVKDVDLENNIVRVNETKNHKPLLVPLNATLVIILKEYLRNRHHNSLDDYLFCNVYGQQLCKSTVYHMLYDYNKKRDIETTGMHRYRHTFAKQWILNGGNVVTLSKLLGHSSLNITQNYINLLVSDVAKQVEEINVLDKYAERKSIKLR